MEGAAVSPKLERATTDKEVTDTADWFPAVIVIGPVVAPDGITNERRLELELETGAVMVPPPC